MEHHQASNQKKIKQSQQDKNSQKSYSSEEINSMTRNKKLKIVYKRYLIIKFKNFNWKIWKVIGVFIFEVFFEIFNCLVKYHFL